MRARIGTSGYAYPAWRGSFYPVGMAPRDFLAFYASRFDAVEINATFYRMPVDATVAGWKDHVPRGFAFALKAPMAITHRKRLREAEQPVAHFFRVAAGLGPRLGPVLFQLPPNLRCDVPRLSDFLASIPPGRRVAFEFRHPSWFDDAVYETLAAHGAALCLAESEELATPLVATARFGYLRLRELDYSQAKLRTYCEFLLAQPWSTAYVFFKHEDEGHGPVLAARLRALLGPEAAAHP